MLDDKVADFTLSPWSAQTIERDRPMTLASGGFGGSLLPRGQQEDLVVVSATLVPGSFSIAKPESVYEGTALSEHDLDERVCGMTTVESNRGQESTNQIQSISDLAFHTLGHSPWVTLTKALMVTQMKQSKFGKQYEYAANTIQ